MLQDEDQESSAHSERRNIYLIFSLYYYVTFYGEMSKKN